MSSSCAGMHVSRSSRIYPNQCFCRSIQTETYNVVRGSYIPKTETKDQNEAKVFGSFFIYFNFEVVALYILN